MHAEGAHEIAFHEPERLGQQQGVGYLGGHAIDHLAPELLRKDRIELRSVHGVLGSRRDSARVSGPWEPQTLVVLLGQGHGRVEADDGELPRHVQDGLDDRFAQFRQQEVQLRRVVPGHAGAVVAVIDVAHVAGRIVHALKDYRSVAVLPVAVLDAYRDALVVAQVTAGIGIDRERRLVDLQEPVWMLDDPARIDAHVVGHHVARQTDAPLCGAPLQVGESLFAAERGGDGVVVEGIRRGQGFGVAHVTLDLARRRRTLPDTDQPQAREAPARQPVEFTVGYLIEPVDVALVELGKLIEPHVYRLGHQRDVAHPVGIVAEGSRFGVGVIRPEPVAAELEHRRRSRFEAPF